MCEQSDDKYYPAIDREQHLEKLLQPVYEDTKWLWMTCLFVSSAGLLGSMNIFSYQFLGKTPLNFWCKIDALSNTSWTQNEIKRIAIPRVERNGTDEYSQCYIYQLDYEMLSIMPFDDAMEYVNDNGRNNTIECSRRYFDGDVDSFVSYWDLVCNRRSLYATAQSAIQSGFIIDSFLFGYLTDRFGRRPLFLSSFGLCVFCGMVLTVVPYLWLFITFRMLLSTFSFSAINSGIAICLERCSVKRRSLIGQYFSLPWALGIMILPLISFYVRTWYYLQLTINLPFVFIFIMIWLSGVVAESPRWLILNKKYDAAYNIIRKSADSAYIELPPKEQMLREMELTADQHHGKKEGSICQNIVDSLRTVTSLFTRKDLRITTMLVFFIWFTSSMVYYGVGLGADAISANEYLYMFLSGVVELFALLLLWPITAYFGRRFALFLYFVTSAVSILTVASLQYFLQQSELEWLRVVLYLSGKFSIAAAFQLIWVYTSELYPTNMRCLAAGGGSTIAKVGSFFSPYVNDLLGIKVHWAPAATFGGFSLLSTVMVKILPETVDNNLKEDFASPEIHEHPKTSTDSVEVI